MCPYNARLRIAQRKVAAVAPLESTDLLNQRQGRYRGPAQSDSSHEFDNYGLTEEELAERRWEDDGGPPGRQR